MSSIYDFPYPFQGNGDVGNPVINGGQPVTLSDNSPFFGAPIPPEDEHGDPLVSYYSQAVFFEIRNIGLTNPPAAPQSQTYTVGFGAAFKDANGVVIGTIQGQGIITKTWTQISSNPAIYTSEISFSFSTGATPGAKIRDWEAPPSPSYAISNGAIGDESGFDTPLYAFNVPLGATIQGSVSVSASPSGTLHSPTMKLRVAGRPKPSATLSATGAVTATKAGNSQSTNSWEPQLDKTLGSSPLYTATAWDAYYPSGSTWKRASATPNGDTAAFQIDDLDEGPQYVYVRVTSSDGLIGWTSAGATIEGGDQYGAIITPTGALYIPTKSGSGSKIVRFNQGVSPETVIELPSEKGVHLMRHGATFYKGNSANLLEKSANEGETWTVLSNAFTNDYKCIDWVATSPDGGFIAIATKAKLLYSATSFDGTNWGAPVFQFGDGTRDVSRSQIEQSSASDESHILISDGTFAVRSDDYCATPGEVLFQ